MPRKTATAAAKPPQAVKISRPQVPALYGLQGDTYLPWSFAEEKLTSAKNYWICTARADGRPHSIPVSGFWLDGAFCFGTARDSQKGKNLTRNPAISVHLESGDEVVILEGHVEEIDLADKNEVKRLDDASKAKYKMPLMILPASVCYRVRPLVVLAWREKDFPNSATRWQFTV